MSSDRSQVCPVNRAGSLDNRIRRWLHNPRAILAPFVRQGMKVLDVGCGPGVFSIELARMVGPGGKVLAADLQEGMLERVGNKIKGTELESVVELVKCDAGRINVVQKVDFILAFYMVHEVPDKNSLFRQLRDVLHGSGHVLLVEPKLLHVSRKEFVLTLKVAENEGFTVAAGPKIRLSWSAVLSPA